jgi:Ca2+-binding EF-hand superfamily protein
MGVVQSRAKEHEVLKRYAEWTREQANNVTNRYKALDLEFGLDIDSLSQLLEDDTASAEALKCFGRGNGTVNALELLVAINLVAQGTEDEAIKSMFVVFDFGGIGSTSYDEFAIFMLVFARILVIIAKADPKTEPSDQLVDQIVRQTFAPTDRVELEQCIQFANDIFPIDAETKERTLETLLKPYDIPLSDNLAELGALLGVVVPAETKAPAETEAPVETEAPAETEADTKAAPVEEEKPSPAEAEEAAETPLAENEAAPVKEEKSPPAEAEEVAETVPAIPPTTEAKPDEETLAEAVHVATTE